MVLVLFMVAIVVSLVVLVVPVVDSDVALLVMAVGVVGPPVVGPPVVEAALLAFSLGIELKGNAVVAVVVLSTDVAGEVSKTVVLLVVVAVSVKPFGLAVSV